MPADSAEHPAGSMAKLRAVIGGLYLELLHRVLRKGRKRAGTARVILAPLLGHVDTILEKDIVPGHSAKRNLAARSIGGDARR